MRSRSTELPDIDCWPRNRKTRHRGLQFSVFPCAPKGLRYLARSRGPQVSLLQSETITGRGRRGPAEGCPGAVGNGDVDTASVAGLAVPDQIRKYRRQGVR